MKKLLTITTLFFPALLFAQQKKWNFFKDLLYVKVSPTLYGFIDESDDQMRSEGLAPVIFGVIGAKIRYAAVGFSIGRFKLREAGTITPRGIDLTITDFKQKLFPVLTAQWHQTHFEESYSITRNSGMRVEGKEMYSIGAGASFRTLKTLKIMLTAGVATMNCNLTEFSRPAPNYPSYYHYSKGHHKMIFIALSVVW